MNRLHHDVLKYIYQRNEVAMRDLTEAMERKYNDHRDFYPLAGLVIEGFVGFTGGLPTSKPDGALTHQDAYFLSRVFQCYAQGKGNQSYQEVTIFTSSGDSHLFIAAKGLLYFHEYKEKRREWWTVAALGLISAIIAGCVTGALVAS
jgi:hypothetical protein